MWRRLAVQAVMAALIAATAGCHAQIRRDFAAFDRAYIPALTLTNEGSPEAARLAMAPLIRQYMYLWGEHHRDKGMKPGWQTGIDEVGVRVTGAGDLVREGQLPQAHEMLEGVRGIFTDLRQRNGIAYYLDWLNRFHEPMERIFMAARGKTPNDLTDADLATIRAALPEAVALWHDVATKPFDASLFGFDAQKVGRKERLVQVESDALTRLRKALDAGQPAEILAAARAIRGPYRELYLLFGDFPAGTAEEMKPATNRANDDTPG